MEDGDVVFIPKLDPSDIENYDRFLVARSTLAQPTIEVRFINYAGGGGVGRVTLENGSTFVDAITEIRVNADQARLGDVALIRFDPETGRAVTISLDAKDAIRGDITQNPPLEDNDVIIVGRTLIGRITFALGQFTRPFRDILGFVLFFDSLIDNADNLFSP
ncbi:hypothetical protein [Vasconcelosia minhoensis]|uniref:hypothetical protein n=1 Tax=Vasconcelosia minhoensis TaxID=3366354 RepID=UPI001D14B833|nr:hypothetical protein [Romeria gracilis]